MFSTLLSMAGSIPADNDSINVAQNSQLKNAIRIDGFGKSVLYGIAYDRIVYSKGKLDLHANVAWHEPPYLSSVFYSFGTSFYATVDQFKINPLFGVGYTHYHIVEDFGTIGSVQTTTHNIPMLILGGQFVITKEWSLQLHYTPSYSFTSFLQEDPLFEDISRKEQNLGLLWGGFSLGYHF